MSAGGRTNLPATVLARLRNLARQEGRTAQEMDQHYALERFLYRLSLSPYAERFVLKGALLLLAWSGLRGRATRDVDLLSYADNSVESVVAMVRAICSQQVAPDGMWFDPESVYGRPIAERSEYAGVRVTFVGYLGETRLPLQADIGFGDAVYPAPQPVRYPCLLGGEPLTLSGYTKESVVAEKLEAMVFLGEANSRYKDFYDLWLLAQRFGFDGVALTEAVRRTFERRGTSLTEHPVCLSAEYAAARERQAGWRAFLRRTGLEGVPGFPSVVATLAGFLAPVMAALAPRAAFARRWLPGGPWTAG